MCVYVYIWQACFALSTGRVQQSISSELRCVCERERVCVCERERERESERERRRERVSFHKTCSTKHFLRAEVCKVKMNKKKYFLRS
jgi:hypothetical protein